MSDVVVNEQAVGAGVWENVLRVACGVCTAEIGAPCISVGRSVAWRGRALKGVHQSRAQAAEATYGSKRTAAAAGAYTALTGQNPGEYTAQQEASWQARLRSVQRLREGSNVIAAVGTRQFSVQDVRNVLDLVDQLMRSAAYGRPVEPGQVVTAGTPVAHQ